MKIFLVILVIGLIVVCGIVDNYCNNKDGNDSKLFQGPVPEGYDEEHFRLTGETKLIEVKE